jgi:parvulin-like peptidyl-prolyl isomerase
MVPWSGANEELSLDKAGSIPRLVPFDGEKMNHSISMTRYIFPLAIASCLACAGVSAQSAVDGESIIARAGNIDITEREFLERFELVPSLYRHRKPQLQQAKLELLYAMVAEKLLAQEALERGLDQRGLFQLSLLNVRKLLARDELYRREISNNVVITPAEVEEEVRRAGQLVLLAFKYFDREDEATFVRRRIETGEDFDRIVVDDSFDALEDTATVIWGDALADIEEAAYRLNPGEVSPVVRAGTGFYILKCLSIRAGTHLNHLQPETIPGKARARLRQRKEMALMHDFMSRTLHQKAAHARTAQLKMLADALSRTMAQQTPPSGDSLIVLTSDMLPSLLKHISTFAHDTLCVVGDTVWSVGDAVDKLYSKGFRIRPDQVKHMFARLNGDLEYWAQQDVLSQIALDRGLDRVPEIRRKLEMWNHAYLSDMMKIYTREHVKVSEAEFWAYLKWKDEQTRPPMVMIRELRTSTLDRMQEALADLQDGVSFEEVVRRWSEDASARETGGLTPFFPITDRPQIGEIAAEMEVGERHGPVATGSGMVLFEFVAKTAAPHEADTSFAERREREIAELLARKQQGTLNRFLAQVAQQREVMVYMDRLKELKVTSTPMLTYRLLGFGGRMFEVPFVDPQLQWLNVDPPDTQVLP